jgi:hypothetical protein
VSDIAAGWLTSKVVLAHADAYAGYLEMAGGLSGQGYKDAAAAHGNYDEAAVKALVIGVRDFAARHPGVGHKLSRVHP